jgi:excisionase family DNA binding protein
MPGGKNDHTHTAPLCLDSRAAAYVGVHPKTIRRHIAAGRLPGYHLGQRLIRVDLDELDQLMARNPTVRPDEDVSARVPAARANPPRGGGGPASDCGAQGQTIRDLPQRQEVR